MVLLVFHRSTLALACIMLFIATMVMGAPAGAKARIVVVFTLRSTPDLQSQATAVSQQIADRIGALDGYDANVMPEPSGPAGPAAAQAGGVLYVRGQLAKDDSGMHATLGSFSAATDQPVGTLAVTLTPSGALPSDVSMQPLVGGAGDPSMPPAAGGPPAPGGPAAPAMPPVATSIPTPAGPPAPSVVVVPRGLIIPVATAETYDSSAVQTGEKIRYVILGDVIVNGFVVAHDHDPAEGVVQTAQAGDSGVLGIGRKSANLTVSVDAAYTFCGDTLHLSFDRNQSANQASNRNVQIPSGQMYVAVTDRVQKVCGVPTTATPGPLPNTTAPQPG